MALHHGVVNQRYSMNSQKEQHKNPFDWLRLSIVLAGVALLVGVIIFPQNRAAIAVFGIIVLFMVTMMYAKALQKRPQTR